MENSKKCVHFYKSYSFCNNKCIHFIILNVYILCVFYFKMYLTNINHTSNYNYNIIAIEFSVITINSF